MISYKTRERLYVYSLILFEHLCYLASQNSQHAKVSHANNVFCETNGEISRSSTSHLLDYNQEPVLASFWLDTLHKFCTDK